jgi:hypothetical protein
LVSIHQPSISGAAGRKEIQMTLYVTVGEWYWGAKCPKSGEMTAHAHDPMRGQGDSKITNENPGEEQVTMTCPNGHFFPARTENLLRFEWRSPVRQRARR